MQGLTQLWRPFHKMFDQINNKVETAAKVFLLKCIHHTHVWIYITSTVYSQISTTRDLFLTKTTMFICTSSILVPIPSPTIPWQASQGRRELALYIRLRWLRQGRPPLELCCHELCGCRPTTVIRGIWQLVQKCVAYNARNLGYPINFNGRMCPNWTASTSNILLQVWRRCE